jgi:hypothetical protein
VPRPDQKTCPEPTGSGSESATLHMNDLKDPRMYFLVVNLKVVVSTAFWMFQIFAVLVCFRVFFLVIKSRFANLLSSETIKKRTKLIRCLRAVQDYRINNEMFRQLIFKFEFNKLII